jgi:hypothetical protein
MLADRPAWLPPERELAEYYGHVAAYPYYRLQLTQYIARLLPAEGPCRLIDVGAGDGSLGGVFQRWRPATRVLGVETFLRRRKWRFDAIPLVQFDGARLPFPDASFDCALLSNVLHHVGGTAAQLAALREVRRVTRRRIIVKDHRARHALDRAKLAFLDVAGNRRFGASTTGDYQSDRQWKEILDALDPRAVERYGALSFRNGWLERVFGNELEIVFALDF